MNLGISINEIAKPDNSIISDKMQDKRHKFEQDTHFNQISKTVPGLIKRHLFCPTSFNDKVRQAKQKYSRQEFLIKLTVGDSVPERRPDSSYFVAADFNCCCLRNTDNY